MSPPATDLGDEPDSGDPPARGSLRVLVLSADVGEGHMAAARAIGEGLRALGAEVRERDGLGLFGRALRYLIRDGYRVQLRWAPWSYSASYRLIAHMPPARGVGGAILGRLGRRRLRKMLAREEPDVIVSTHPALTCLLGRERLRGRVRVPVCAPITDLADFAFWSHRGADLHLVVHPTALAPVERIAGAGSAALIRPLVARRFLGERDQAAARAALELPAAGAVVAISGGGWGIGDLRGAVDSALEAGADVVVVLAGHNDEAREALERRFEADRRVRVWGFTRRMDELLRAADALVHSTGGVTSFEALTTGCPLVAYGTMVGHIRVHNRTMAALGLITLAATRDELTTELRRLVGAGPPAPAPVLGGSDAAELVAHIRARVRPLPVWRLRVQQAIAPLLCVAAMAGGVTSEDAYSLTSHPLELRPTTHVATAQPVVGLVVRAPAGQLGALAGGLATDGIHVSFATTGQVAPAAARQLAALGDDVVPELRKPGTVSWLTTRGAVARAPRMGTDRVYLAPPQGLGLAQYLLGRTRDASPLAGQERLRLGGSPPLGPPVTRGDIVVASGSPGAPVTPAAVEALADRLASAGLRPVPLSSLLAPASTNPRNAGERSSAAAPPTTAASPTTTPSTANAE